MNLPRASVRRPVFTTMVTLIVVILGSVSLSRLRIDLLPTVELPTVTVRTSYEGASPEVMERLVTQILEEIIATVPGVEEMTSTSYEGNSKISSHLSVTLSSPEMISRVTSGGNGVGEAVGVGCSVDVDAQPAMSIDRATVANRVVDSLLMVYSTSILITSLTQNDPSIPGIASLRVPSSKAIRQSAQAWASASGRSML